MIHLSAAALRSVLTDNLLETGTGAEATECVVTSLVETSLRGTDSHGIHLFPHYVRAARGGQVADRALQSGLGQCGRRRGSRMDAEDFLRRRPGRHH